MTYLQRHPANPAVRRARQIAQATLLGAAAAILAASNPASALASAKKLPSWAAVQQSTLQYFAGLAKYKPRDLICRSEAEAVFDRLAKLGWNVAGREEILKRTLADDDFLVKSFRTPNGRKFMRQISGFPLGYDRTYRLAGIIDGQKTVLALINGTGGYQFIQYLTTSSGGKEMGKMLGNVSGGADFNAPTGKIFTAEALLAQLKASYEQASK